MNIKELIEAGKYPVDAKGRALVPTRGGDTVTILATDVSNNMPIAGFNENLTPTDWRSDGCYFWSGKLDVNDLMPPPTSKLYIVWNEAKTEGYVTTDSSVARRIQSDEAGDEAGTVAVAFCEAYADQKCTIEEIER